VLDAVEQATGAALADADHIDRVTISRITFLNAMAIS
jgi:hypothetical protein